MFDRHVEQIEVFDVLYEHKLSHFFSVYLFISFEIGGGERFKIIKMKLRKGCEGQVWEHAPVQRVAASTFRRYSRGLRLAIPQADEW